MNEMPRVSAVDVSFVIGLPLCIFGSGGQGQTAADIQLATGKPRRIVFLDDEVSRYNERGREMLEDRAFLSEHELIVAVGDNATRKLLAETAIANGASFDTLIHPSVVVLEPRQLGPGCTVGAHAYIGPRALIGPLGIIGSLVNIPHDCNIGYCCNICDGAVLGGGVDVGDLTFIGLNATLLPTIKIGKGAVVGAGAVVTMDVPAGETWVGNPARWKGSEDNI